MPSMIHSVLDPWRQWPNLFSSNRQFLAIGYSLVRWKWHLRFSIVVSKDDWYFYWNHWTCERILDEATKKKNIFQKLFTIKNLIKITKNKFHFPTISLYLLTFNLNVLFPISYWALCFATLWRFSRRIFNLKFSSTSLL